MITLRGPSTVHAQKFARKKSGLIASSFAALLMPSRSHSGCHSPERSQAHSILPSSFANGPCERVLLVAWRVWQARALRSAHECSAFMSAHAQLPPGVSLSRDLSCALLPIPPFCTPSLAAFSLRPLPPARTQRQLQVISSCTCRTRSMRPIGSRQLRAQIRRCFGCWQCISCMVGCAGVREEQLR
jgi:hypothetical protein